MRISQNINPRSRIHASKECECALVLNKYVNKKSEDRPESWTGSFGIHTIPKSGVFLAAHEGQRSRPHHERSIFGLIKPETFAKVPGWSDAFHIHFFFFIHNSTKDSKLTKEC